MMMMMMMMIYFEMTCTRLEIEVFSTLFGNSQDIDLFHKISVHFPFSKTGWWELLQDPWYDDPHWHTHFVWPLLSANPIADEGFPFPRRGPTNVKQIQDSTQYQFTGQRMKLILEINLFGSIWDISRQHHQHFSDGIFGSSPSFTSQWSAKKLVISDEEIGVSEKTFVRCHPFIWVWPVVITYGGFHKWGYPQIIDFNWIFHYKPSILGYPHFRKPPDPHISLILSSWDYHPFQHNQLKWFHVWQSPLMNSIG